MGEVGLIAALGELFTGLTWQGVGVGSAALLAVAVAYRMIKEKISPLQALGFKNGYVQEKTFLSAVKDIKDLVIEKAEAEGKRMDKHGEEIDALREQVQVVSEKVAEVSTKVEMMEQYRK